MPSTDVMVDVMLGWNVTSFAMKAHWQWTGRVVHHCSLCCRQCCHGLDFSRSVHGLHPSHLDHNDLPWYALFINTKHYSVLLQVISSFLSSCATSFYYEFVNLLQLSLVFRWCMSVCWLQSACYDKPSICTMSVRKKFVYGSNEVVFHCSFRYISLCISVAI